MTAALNILLVSGMYNSSNNLEPGVEEHLVDDSRQTQLSEQNDSPAMCVDHISDGEAAVH